MNKNELLKILEEWNFWKKDLDTGIRRDFYLKKLKKIIPSEQIIVITGARRSGKSFIMKQLAKELIEKLRNQLKSNRAPKLEDLPDEEDCPIQYINFCQVQKYREELKYILEEVSKIPNIEVRNNAYCDCYRIHGKLVGEVFCLKRQWSARVVPNRVRRWDTADEYLEALKARIAEIPAKAEQKDKPVVNASKSKKIESVEDIKGRIEKLSNGHNAIHIKNITAEIKAFVEAQKYKLIDSEEGGANLLVR